MDQTLKYKTSRRKQRRKSLWLWIRQRIFRTHKAQTIRQNIVKVDFIKMKKFALAAVSQWFESWPGNQRVSGSIPGQGTWLGCRPGPQCGARERQPHIDVSLPLFLLPFPSLKVNKTFLKKKKDNEKILFFKENLIKMRRPLSGNTYCKTNLRKISVNKIYRELFTIQH